MLGGGLKEKLLFWFLEKMIGMIDEKQLKIIADWMLDQCENAIKTSQTDLDNKFLLPLIGKIRQAFNVPDND